jgi:hypothetical protein
MASFGDWLSDKLGITGLTRMSAGANPLTAFFTPPPKAGDKMGGGTYYSPELDKSAPPAAYGVTPQASAAPTVPGTGQAGGGGSYDPNTDPGMVGQARNQVTPLISTLNSLYENLNSALPAFAQDSRSEIAGRYNPQYEAADKSYQSAVDNTNQQYTARGAYDSSYRGNANDTNTNDHTKAITALNNNRGGEENDLGKFIAQEQSALADRPNYNLDDYTDVNSLLGLRDELDNHISSLKRGPD